MSTLPNPLARLPPLVLGLFLLQSSLALAPPLSSWTVLPAVTLYVLLTAVLHALVQTGAAVGFPAALLGAAPAAAVVLLQLHLHRDRALPAPGAAVLALAVAVLYALAVHRGARPPAARPHLVMAIGASSIFLLLLGLCYHGAPQLRWHLLRHHRLLGWSAYQLFDPGITAHRTASATRLADLPPPPDTAPRAAMEVSGTPPNLVLVVLDTLRADGLRAWGGREGLMPALDHWLEGATRFDDVWANASWTRPSVVSLLTGLLPEEHGARDLGDRIEPRLTLLPERLQAQGYITVAFLTNLAALGRATGFGQGFHQFHEVTGAPYARAEVVARQVERWLQGPQAPRHRLFLYLHFLDPHEPGLEGPAPHPPRHRERRTTYGRELSYLDRHLVPLLDRLERTLEAPTMFAVVSDHGEELGEHGGFGHGHTLYQELLHVPVAIRGAGPAGTVGAPLELRDLFDLLLEIAAGDPVDLHRWAAHRARRHRYASVDLTRDERSVFRPELRRATLRAVVDGRRKLIWSAHGDTRELYDLAADPAERQNLAFRAPAEARRLAAALDGAVRYYQPTQGFATGTEALHQLRALGYGR
jgi:arylsulfatase A-like enzyme